ncbi:hypothetical protein GCM10022275_04170 [Tessaracoccus defluvii]
MILEFPTKTPSLPSSEGCPAWCVRRISTFGISEREADEPDHFHASEPRVYVERDDEGEPVFAVRISVEDLLMTPRILFRTWQATDWGGFAECEALLTPDEARAIAQYLLAAAHDAAGSVA